MTGDAGAAENDVGQRLPAIVEELHGDDGVSGI